MWGKKVWDANGSPVQDEAEEKTKHCKHCKKVLAVKEFNRNKYSADGFNFYCRTCTNDYRRKREHEFVQGASSRHGS